MEDIVLDNSCSGVELQGGAYGFVTARSFPGVSRLASPNSVTVIGNVPDSADGYHQRCLGVAEADAVIGYFGYICNDSHWYISSVYNLGTSGVNVPSQISSGDFAFAAGTNYQLSMAFTTHSVVLSIALTQGSASPETLYSGSTGDFSPTVVGVGFKGVDYNYALDPSEFDPAVVDFSYRSG